jgi:hypothetical protein
MNHRSEAIHRLGLLAGAFVLSVGTACMLTPAMAAGESGSSGGGSGGGGNAGGGSDGGQGGRSSNMTTAREARSIARDPVDACRSAARS